MKRYYINPNLPENPMREDNGEALGDWVKHDEAHALLKEAYETMISTSIRYCNDGKSCKHCKELVWGRSSEEKVKHKPGCIVNKAEQWLKENR